MATATETIKPAPVSLPRPTSASSEDATADVADQLEWLAGEARAYVQTLEDIECGNTTFQHDDQEGWVTTCLRNRLTDITDEMAAIALALKPEVAELRAALARRKEA